MTTFVALLRGINVGGRNPVAMSDLRQLAAGLDLEEPRTLLQSGNLVFRSEGRTAEIARRLEDETKKRLALATTFILRTAKEWATIIARNPLADMAAGDPSHLVVVFLQEAPTAKAWKALAAAITGPEILSGSGKEAYIAYTAGIGRSRLTIEAIESKLGTRGTGRNWNTVLKLATLLED
ncbi:MAG: DUF1697 domain-containing protein [Proteobacteria bacterium]|nr:DUF1697 domain-containing protein [Pseudomonadota bacterium]MBI3498752.1 DUF1697 domain-containing protein [Pseudomonadota bacterium]